MGQPVLGLEFFTLDVFTDQRFGGNPLAVVLGADGLSDAQMALIAREFNLSETLFVQTPEDPANSAKVRIFTPTQELPFAGHPTVGAASLLADMGSDLSQALDQEIRLEEKVGVVPVKVSRPVGEAIYGELTAAQLPAPLECEATARQVAAALSLAENDIGFGLHETCVFDAGNAPIFVPVASRNALAMAKPAAQDWSGLGTPGKFGAYVYCRAENKPDCFHARFFAPEVGVVEDPATGSAAVAFAGALNKALMLENGAHRWNILQGEDMGRPSLLELSVEVENSALMQVRVGGNSVRVSRGVLTN